MKAFSNKKIKKYYLLIILFVSFVDVAYTQQSASAQLKDNGVSRSSTRQFVVHGDDSVARGVVCVFSERIKSDLLKLFNIPDRWNFPVVIHVRGDIRDLNTGNPIKSSIYKLPGDRYRFQIDVFLGDKFKAQILEEELVQALIMELILRSQKRRIISNRNAFIPEWIKIGVTQVLNSDGKKLNNSTISKFVNSDKILSLHEMLNADREVLDSISTEVYKVSCGAFIDVLLRQKDGSLRLQNYLLGISAKEGKSLEKLKEIFPDGFDNLESLEEWWNNECRKKAEPSATDILTPLETEKDLVECLKIKIIEPSNSDAAAEEGKRFGEKIRSFFSKPKENANPKKENTSKDIEYDYLIYDLKDYRQFIEDKGMRNGLKFAESKLLKLSYRAFPTYKSIIQEYQKILINIGAGRLKNIDQKIEELQNVRSSIIESVNHARDYLNWYEATKIDKKSTNYSKYQKIYNELKLPLPPRKDELSEYLDELDKEFKR